MQIFDEKHISSAPIVNSTGHAVGLITESDVVRALSNRHHQYLDPIAAVIRSGVDDRKITEKLEHVLKLNVLELGRRHIITVPDRASLEDVARIMSEDRLTKLYVRATGNTNNGADSGTENGADDRGGNKESRIAAAANAANSPVPSPAIAREQAANSRGVICGVINRSDLIRFALLKSHSTEVLSG
ncbi:CBS domain-containing protein [Arcanobacterium hippocoleae]